MPTPYFLHTLLAALFILAGCSASPNPQSIVDRAIAVHGGDQLRRTVVDFDFRGKHYTALRDGGRFRYERVYIQSGDTLREVLNNDELYRTVNGRRVEVPADTLLKIETALNSVVYFALLPYNLNDPAVQKRYLGETMIDGAPYHEIEVTFRQEGGGRDHEDRFIYWIHREHYTMDYLAYAFHVNGGGTRFRKAVNTRTIGGVRFADYLNYTSEAVGFDIEQYDRVAEEGRLNLLSEIILENVQVRSLKP